MWAMLAFARGNDDDVDDYIAAKCLTMQCGKNKVFAFVLYKSFDVFLAIPVFCDVLECKLYTVCMRTALERSSCRQHQGLKTLSSHDRNILAMAMGN